MTWRAARIAAFFLVATQAANPASADWSGFYRPSGDDSFAWAARSVDPANDCGSRLPALSSVPGLEEANPDCTPVTQVPPEHACIRTIQEAQIRYDIPGNYLLKIGLQESGMEIDGQTTVWPWSVRAEGRGRFFESRNEALAWAGDQREKGARLIDIGCMQIGLRWHPDAFSSLEEAMDPDRNVDHAARHLLELFSKTGDWMRAVGAYHSADPGQAARYLDRIASIRIDANQDPLSAASPGITDLDALLDTLVLGDVDEKRPLWSAGLGASPADGRGHGLYGWGGLDPFLPDFERDF